MATLEIINLCKRYRDFSLGPIDLQLEPGTVHGLIGANGAGKSTFYRCLMGTVRKDQGIIKLNVRIATPPPGQEKVPPGQVSSWVFNLQPGDEIGMEVHDDHDQFIRVESGSGAAILNGERHDLSDGVAVVVPAGVLGWERDAPALVHWNDTGRLD